MITMWIFPNSVIVNAAVHIVLGRSFLIGIEYIATAVSALRLFINCLVVGIMVGDCSSGSCVHPRYFPNYYALGYLYRLESKFGRYHDVSWTAALLGLLPCCVLPYYRVAESIGFSLLWLLW